MKLTPVILSGGSGTRLWPLSRQQYPKQYLTLVGEHTMLQETILRLKGLENLTDPTIICNVEHRFLVAEQCQQIGIKKPTILLEPIGKNTAPAIAAAAYNAIKYSLGRDNSLLLILSADHLIQDSTAFHQAINVAIKQAQLGELVTFGVVPKDANTNYGYIETETPCKDKMMAQKVKSFHEKPDQKVANRYLQNDNFLWNAGMFMFQVETLLNELTIHAPEIVASAKDAIDQSEQDLYFTRMAPFEFETNSSTLSMQHSKLSIDYALMEKAHNVVVVPLEAGWNDIGAWSALYEIGKKDANNNVIKGDVLITETTNSYINADHHMIATIGIDNLIIVDTPDATLVATKDKVQEVKKIVKQLNTKNSTLNIHHLKVHRPWGWYKTIDKESRFQVKRICVNPGASLSLQKHYHRAEHWIIVKGTAKITNGNKTELLRENQSTYIPVGELHRLENPGMLPLEMIEVQSGSYLGEDDIERLDDCYGRLEISPII